LGIWGVAPVVCVCVDVDDDKFIPTKHLTPPPTTAAASPQPLTPKRRHPCCTKKKGKARRRTASTDWAHSWATQARPRRMAWARGTVQRHVDAVRGVVLCRCGYVCVCDLLICLQNKLDLNKIPHCVILSTYSTCRAPCRGCAKSAYGFQSGQAPRLSVVLRGLYKIYFYIQHFVPQSIIPPPPTCIAHTVAILSG